MSARRVFGLACVAFAVWIIAFILWPSPEVTGQPVPSPRVQDLRDAKISTTLTPGLVLVQATNSAGVRYWTNDFISSTNVSMVTSNITTYDITVLSNLYFVSGKGNTLIVTQYVRMPWTTLTMSGSNVSALDLSAASMFKLTLTNNGYITTPTGLPGTNQAQTIQIAIQQDSAGARTLTMTNGSWVLNGSGESTNAVPSITTNANAVSILTFVTSPFNAGKLYGVNTPFVP